MAGSEALRPSTSQVVAGVSHGAPGSPKRCDYQQAMFEQGQPAVMFYVDDVRQEHDRMAAAGAAFTMPPTKVTGSTIAVLDDTSGNLIQIVTLDRWQ